MEHHNGFPKREGIRTGRVVNWAQVCVTFLRRKRRSQQIPNCKVKYGSYPSKNIPYFIHLLSLHVFYRISGLTLPIWGNRKTPSCLERLIIQRRQNKYDLCHRALSPSRECSVFRNIQHEEFHLVQRIHC